MVVTKVLSYRRCMCGTGLAARVLSPRQDLQEQGVLPMLMMCVRDSVTLGAKWLPTYALDNILRYAVLSTPGG